MYVGIGYIKIKIYDAYSLKDRRQIVNSITSKIKSNFNVSISIIDDGSLWNIAELGIAVVSSSKQVIESTFNKIDDFLEEDHRFEVIEYDTDIQKEM